MSTRTPSSSSSRLMLTIGLCFLVALMEGLDLQAAGIAAGGIAQAFALDKMQMGWIFSAGILGLLPGALVGGMLADRYGRKCILIGSVALFGLFSLATAIAWDFPSLVFARLMTGVGLGAALPNLIALTSEAAGPRFRGTAVSLMYCGVPIGAALAATLGFAGGKLSMANGVLGRWCGAVDSGAAINALAAGVGGFRWRKTVCATTACLICARNGNRDAAAVVVLFLHSAGGLHVDQLATATFGGARIPAIAGGRGDVCPANGGGKRDVNVGRIDG